MLDNLLAKKDGKCAARQHLLGRLRARLACRSVWSTFISPRTKGREVLRSTDGLHCFQADKGCYGREFSDFQNIKMLNFHCVLFDDHCLVSGLRRPFWLHQHSGGRLFRLTARLWGEDNPRCLVGCGFRVTGGVRSIWHGGGWSEVTGLAFWLWILQMASSKQGGFGASLAAQ